MNSQEWSLALDSLEDWGGRTLPSASLKTQGNSFSYQNWWLPWGIERVHQQKPLLYKGLGPQNGGIWLQGADKAEAEVEFRVLRFTGLSSSAESCFPGILYLMSLLPWCFSTWTYWYVLPCHLDETVVPVGQQAQLDRSCVFWCLPKVCAKKD